MPFSCPHPLSIFFPTFLNRRLEARFRRCFHAQQVVADALVSIVGIAALAALVWQAQGSHLDISLAFAWLIILVNALPLATLIFNRRDYVRLRSRIVLFQTVLGWHFDFQVFSHLSKPPVDDMHPLPSRLQKWMLLLRSRAFIMLWVNLGQRLPFMLHAPVHLLGLLVELRSTAERCRWAPQPLLTDLAGIMRGLLRVPQPPPGSFAALPQGACTVGISFLQLLVGYLLPCLVSLLMELNARHAFLKRRLQQEVQAGADPASLPHLGEWRSSKLLSWHMLWQVPVTIAACWRLAESAAAYFAPASVAQH